MIERRYRSKIALDAKFAPHPEAVEMSATQPSSKAKSSRIVEFCASGADGFSAGTDTPAEFRALSLRRAELSRHD